MADDRQDPQRTGEKPVLPCRMGSMTTTASAVRATVTSRLPRRFARH